MNSERRTTTEEKVDLAKICGIPPNYQGFVIANLDGSAFDISPQGPQREPLDKLLIPFPSIIAWAWSITPKRTGSHKVNLSVDAEWIPNANNGPIIQCDVWDRVIDITVQTPFLARGQIVAGTLISGFIGSILTGPFLLSALSNIRGGRK
jgi:hypothetical protein